MNYGIVLLLSLLITLGAQGYIRSTYQKTRVIESKKRMTGKEVARKILDSNG